MKIGLFGGSFDPPHAGHVALAQAGLDVAGFDEVWIIPANPVHRQLSGCADGSTRLDWMQQLFGNNPRISVVDWEAQLPRPTPAVETLRRFKREYPHDQPWLMLGTDAWRGLDSWREYPAHQQLCNVAVFARAGIDDLPQHAGWQQVAGPEAAQTSGNWCYLPVTLPDIAATALRRDAAMGVTLHGRVPEIIRKAVEAAYQTHSQAFTAENAKYAEERHT